eukprot:2231431-Rhodomonas_salina.1
MANEAMNEPAASQRLLAVQTECAGDISKFFMLAILAATEIVGPTLEKYGFERNQGSFSRSSGAAAMRPQILTSNMLA